MVITHELYTVSGADHIIVLDAGQARQSGTHEQLLEQDGLYRDLCQVQSFS